MEIAVLQIRGANGFAVIDAEDFDKVSTFDWQVEYSNRKKIHIGCRLGKKDAGQKCVRLSHMILGLENSEKNVRVKYLNKNSFDLRKANLEYGFYNEKFSATSEASLSFYCDKSRKVCAWTVVVYYSATQKTFRLGYYLSEEAARAVIKYIQENNISLSTKTELDRAKPVIRKWAIEKGYTQLNITGSAEPMKVYAVGDEKIGRAGFVQIKTEKGWQLKHYWVWKQHGKRITKGHELLFKDGDKRNFDIENLELVSKKESGHRLALSQQPENLRPLLDIVWQFEQEIEKQSKKKTRLLKITDSDKLATVDTADFEKVKDFDWKLLKINKKKIVGYRAKIADRKYKVVTLAHKILDIDVDAKVKIQHKNKRALDYRRSNLDVVYSNCPGFIKPPLYYTAFAKNRKGAKSNWKVDIWLLNRRSTLGYYLTEDSAKAVIAYAKTFTTPLTTWEEYQTFREEIRKWAIENGHATKDFRAKSRELREEKGFYFFIRHNNRKTDSAPPWSLTMRHSAIPGKSEFRFGYFITEAAAKEAIEFINNCGLPLTDKKDAERLKSVVVSWALAKRYVNPPHRRLVSALPNFSFNSNNSKGAQQYV